MFHQLNNNNNKILKKNYENNIMLSSRSLHTNINNEF